MNDWFNPNNPNFFWHCFFVYEVIGLLALLLMRKAVIWSEKNKKISDIQVAIDATFSKEKKQASIKKSWVKEYFKDFKKDPLVNTIAPMFLVLFWPLGVVMAIVAIYDRSILDDFPDRFSSSPKGPEHKFNCKPEYLIRQVQPDEVEAQSFIEDPLGRTPNKPFGHLFSAWQKFVASQGEEQELWLFEVPGVRWAGPLKGYAWVDQSFGKPKIRSEFIFEWD